MSQTEEYKVNLEVFEGPLDLLLYLIKKDEIDIHNIPIEVITSQYMEYLNVMRMLDLNIAGEFIVMAATLMLIKSRMLLPVEERSELAEEDDEDDPRWELVRQLVEYKKFKDAALRLHGKELEQEGIFTIGTKGIEVEAEASGVVLEDVSLFDLISAFNEVLQRTSEEQIGEIFHDQFTVADKIDVVLNTLKRRGQVKFSELFGAKTSRNELICTFLALLELIKLCQVCVIQPDPFGEIVIGSTNEPNEPVESDDGRE
ncbi:MAG: segregation/condensation protein A [Kiritimatiellae bacterium]|nr:segregation/condensation protein A [Kiritimatiellia bacterium]